MTQAQSAADPDAGRVLVIVPTYNEVDNLAAAVAAVRAAVPAADILVADDNSPDGTGDLADRLATADPQVHVLHRAGKAGLGAAYIAGFQWALGRDYGVIVEMDADGSHDAAHLPAMLAALADADLVIGSRWVPGGSVVNWPWSRKVISQGGNLYTRLALGIGVRDATGGYRAFRRTVLEKLPLQEVASQGYCFQVDLTWRTAQAGFRIAEVPITFRERERGESKMSGSIVREAFLRVTQWGTTHRADQVLRALRRRRSASR